MIELAAVCGLDLLPDRKPDPLGASTYGLGDVIRHAIEQGPKHRARHRRQRVNRWRRRNGAGSRRTAVRRCWCQPPRGGGALTSLQSVDLSGLRQFVENTRIVVASDVANPLLGPRGAAAVCGPQKGASPKDVRQLEEALIRWAQAVSEAVGRHYADEPRAGAAAGGTGFAALALLNGELRRGSS